MSLAWNWSPGATAAFVRAATGGRRMRWHIPSGLSAALLEELPLLAPAVIRFWITLLTREPRSLRLRVPSAQYRVLKNGIIEFFLPLDEAFLENILRLDTLPESEPVTLEPPTSPVILGPDGNKILCSCQRNRCGKCSCWRNRRDKRGGHE